MDWISKLPERLQTAFRRLPAGLLETLEEVRMAEGAPVLLRCGRTEYALDLGAESILTQAQIEEIFYRLSDYSAYACQENVAQGFITLEGGHRVGVCGTTVLDRQSVHSLKEISSLNLRICKEYPGCAAPVLPFLLDRQGCFFHTVIVSPPGCGKTTLLRDLIRTASGRGFRVGIVDERSEIAGTQNGKKRFDLGPRVDVLDGCPKAEGILMLIRSMAPDLIATDEIGKACDIPAVESALSAGIRLLTTVHGKNYNDLTRTPLGRFIRRGAFQRMIYLSHTPSVGTIRSVTDETGRILFSETDTAAREHRRQAG